MTLGPSTLAYFTCLSVKNKKKFLKLDKNSRNSTLDTCDVITKKQPKQECDLVSML
jgi:hypothetical protein